MSMNEFISSPLLLEVIQANELNNSPRFDNTSYDQTQRIEKEFCKDFTCCGLKLNDLHELLEHYEEYHLNLINQNINSNNTSDDEDMVINQAFRHQSYRPNNIDISMLNKQKTNSLQIQTMDCTMMDGMNTPSLSPSSPNSHSDFWFYQSNMMSSINGNSTTSTVSEEDDAADKPYRCDVENCDKAYKNANGLKYHRLHGHCPPSDNDEVDANKPFTCSLGNCRKRYKNLNGLKYHIEHTHMLKLTLTSDMFIKNNNNNSNNNTTNNEDAPHGLKRRLSSSSLSSES